jgi:methyl-accepting chemotaxis protein
MFKLKLTTQILIGLGAIFVLLLISDLVGAFANQWQHTLGEQVASQQEMRALVVDLKLSLEMQSNAVRGFMVSGSEAIRARDDEGRRDFSAALQKLDSLSTTPESRQLLSEVQAAYLAYRTGCDNLVQLTRDGKVPDAVTVMTGPEFGKTRARVQQSLAALSERLLQRRSQAEERLEASGRAAQFMTWSLLVVAFLFASLIAFVVTSAVRRKTEILSSMIRRMADGELNIPDGEAGSGDELGIAVSLLNEMKGNFRNLLQNIQDGAENIARASAEIAAAATQQKQSAESQRSQSIMVSSAMQEMSASVREVAQNTSSVARASDEATGIAGEGGDIVSRTLAAMRTIAESVESTSGKVADLGKGSERIGQIVHVIDEIAAQTNLLALNAAIEAARAGEAGRGFAVVAGEVRRLAERTGKATGEISAMIASIQTGTSAAVESMKSARINVEQGVATTEQAGESLSRIIETVGQVGSMVSQIAAATTQQSSTAEEVQTNVQEIAAQVQQSADAAITTEQHCRALNELSEALKFSVEQFQI